MIKIFIIFLLVITAFLYGNFYANRLKKRVENLKLIEVLLDEIILQIRYKSATVYEIMQKLCSENYSNNLEFLNKIKSELEGTNNVFSVIWRENIESQNEIFLVQEDKKLLLLIGEILGRTDKEGQLNSLNYIKKELDLKILKSKQDEQEKSKLYRSLGILSGAFIAILLV